MAFAIPSRAITLNVFETLAIGTAGGVLFLWANFPGGLISGAMIAVGIAAIAGRPLTMPPILTQTGLVLLGISLGSLVSRQLLQHMGAYPLTIALLALATFCSTFGSSIYLQRIHGWDQTSAFLAGSPGALSQITMLAIEKGAAVPAIAVVQTMRVIILPAALPLLLSLTGIAPPSSPAGAVAIASPLELAELIAASVAGGAPPAVAKISGELDVRSDDRVKRSAWHRTDRGRSAAMGARGGAGRHRRADRQPVRADECQDPAQPCQCGAGILRHRHRHFRCFRRGDCADHPCAVRRHHCRVRAGRDGRHAGAGADTAHRSDLRRRASFVALRVRHHHDAGHRPSVRTPAGRCRRLDRGSKDGRHRGLMVRDGAIAP